MTPQEADIVEAWVKSNPEYIPNPSNGYRMMRHISKSFGGVISSQNLDSAFNLLKTRRNTRLRYNSAYTTAMSVLRGESELDRIAAHGLGVKL